MCCSSDKAESWRELLNWNDSVELHNSIGIQEKILNKSKCKINYCSMYEMQKSAVFWLPTDYKTKKTE